MFQNSSPWLFQLNRKRPVSLLKDDIKTDIVIVGGGIAGIVTAYFTLQHTKKKVVLLEAYKIAHGATGHNAGQLASYFERPFSDIVKEFGLELAAEGQSAVDSAWGLLEKIYQDAKLQTAMQQFTGYAGCGTLEEILIHLQDIAYQRQAGIVEELMFIAKEANCLTSIPKKFKDCYTLVPQKKILSLLQTSNPHFIATLLKKKGCLNSALFTEELAGYLLKKYKDRFVLFEHAPVTQIVLRKKTALLATQKYFLLAEKVVLCTNGFKTVSIVDTANDTAIDTKFHHLVRGTVGYMAGYLDTKNEAPIAISYLPDTLHSAAPQESDPYFYLTRRPFENQKKLHNLVCIGGPEFSLDDATTYNKEKHPYPKDAQKAIDAFIHKNYLYAPKKKIQYTFLWHGLMGYTRNGIRAVGFEPCNPVLLYNLGCNGVGILASIYGAKRTALLLSGKKLPKSIFDPQDKTCNPRISSQLFKKRRRI